MDSISIVRESSMTVADTARLFWASRWVVLAFALASGVAAGVICKVLKPVYRAEVVLAPVANTTSGGGLASLAGLAGQFSGLASLAGISLPMDDERSEALATLTSRSLIESFIREKDLLPVVFAEKWDPSRHAWRDPGSKNPTPWDGHKKFKASVLRVSEDRKTGLIMLTVDWTDPTLAAQWANDLVSRCNALMRERALKRATAEIDYVERELKETTRLPVEQVLYRIMETELKKIVIAQGTQEYAFRVVDPAVVPQEKQRPKASLLIPVGILGGAVLGFFLNIVRVSLASRRS